MESKYLEYIQKFLGDAPVMTPEPTDIEPRYSRDEDIRVMIFDIYGTIIISASGDIEESEISSRNLEQALNAAGIDFTQSSRVRRQEILIQMLQSFRKEIERVHETERSSVRPYPEVDIMTIWENILKSQNHSRNLVIADPLCIKCFVFVFETLSNNIYPMPGLKEVVNQINEKGLPMGIISNAQFYTPVILNYFLNEVVSEDEKVYPFDPEITVYSYKHQRAKPDPYLFDIVTGQCIQKYGVRANQILFLGNDMFRDIYPAQRAGYKTVLFAGDNRSLRLREERAEIGNIAPDYVITHLDQLLKIVT